MHYINFTVKYFPGQPKKYLCLVYYKVTADKSTVLDVDMSLGGYYWFREAFKNITKIIKSEIIWVSIRKRKKLHVLADF